MRKFIHTVGKNQTLSSIAKLYNTSVVSITNSNKTPIHEGQRLIIESKNGKMHIVRPFETLAKIATMYGVNESDIIKINNLQSNRIYIGQQLLICE